MTVAVLIPVLNRPERVAPLLDSIEASARYVDLTAVFVVSPGDDAERDAIRDDGVARYREWTDLEDDFRDAVPLTVSWEPGRGDYARKINHAAHWAVGLSSFEFVFLGADDLTFHPGWAERALAAHLETGACVIGTNDLGNPKTRTGAHSTHSLVHRDYLACGTIDEPGLLLHEGYDHQWVDNEFVETAKARGTYAHAADAIVEHHHPMWGTAPDDDTYRKAQRAGRADQALYQKRRRLWAT